MAEPVGETRKSLPKSGAMEDRRLRATLGVYALPAYTLPPNTLVLLEYPPMDPRPDLGFPRNRWLGRIARGMKIKDLSVAGKMYRGEKLGNEMRTGLSRLNGGRWSGNFVYCLICTPGKIICSLIPGI